MFSWLTLELNLKLFHKCLTLIKKLYSNVFLKIYMPIYKVHVHPNFKIIFFF